MKQTENTSDGTGRNVRRLKYGAASSLLVVLVLAAIVLLNFVVTSLTTKFNLKYDLTANSIFRISKESEEFVKNLDKDVTIIVLSDEDDFTAGGDYYVQANEVIRSYERLSPRVTLEYRPLAKNPGLRRKYGEDISTKAVIVTCGDDYRTLSAYQLFNTQSDYFGNETIASSQAEQAMSSAILAVTSDKSYQVSVLTGYGDMDISGVTSTLELNNYTIVSQNLLTEDIDPDSCLAILYAPMRDLDENSLKKLDVFLTNNQNGDKTLLYIPHPFPFNQQTEALEVTPNLNAFLAEWGVTAGDGIVMETDLNNTINMEATTILASYAEAMYSEKVQANGFQVVMPMSRPLELAQNKKSGVTVTTLLTSSASTVIMPFDADQNWQASQAPLSPNLPLATLSTVYNVAGGESHKSNVLVISSFLAVDSSIIRMGVFGNGDYFMGIIHDSVGREASLTLSPKQFAGNPLGISSMQIIVITLIVVLILPLAVLAFGLVTWSRRRKR